MTTTEIKGYLNIETQAEFLSHDRIDDPIPNILSSYAGQGWYAITHSIPDGELVKISAERDQQKVEAKFNVLKNTPHGNNGVYEIRGGLFTGSGKFVNVSKKDRGDLSFQAKDNDKFAHFFVCHSEKKGCGALLRWRIVLQDFQTVEKPIEEIFELDED
jgi:hypothetical protein